MPRHQPSPTSTRHDHLDPGARATANQVLVVVFLRGGADGLTLVPPVADDVYHRARPVLRVAPADALPLTDYFSLNAELAPLLPYFERGELAIVHGTGSEDGSRSHFEAQDTMEHGGLGRGSGWLARLLLERDETPGPLSAVSIGTTRPESLRGAPAGAVIQTVHDFRLGKDDSEETAMLDALSRLYAIPQGPLKHAGHSTLDAVRRLRQLRSDDTTTPRPAAYPDTSFGRGLHEIARLISADVGLVASTIDLGNWDTHFVQATSIGGLMRELGAGLDAFQQELGADKTRVTTIVMTEFGRRLHENTSFGTDHGAGSTLFVLGAGAEREGGGGGTIQSGWADLSDRHLDEVGDVPAAIHFATALQPTLSWHSPDVDLTSVFGA